jgi:hypothetical protein
MMPLAAIAGLAYAFGLFVLIAWNGLLDVRVALGGLYLLIGTVASVGVALLRRLAVKSHSTHLERTS